MRQKYKKGKQGKPEKPEKPGGHPKPGGTAKGAKRPGPPKPEKPRASHPKRVKGAPKRKATELDEGEEEAASYPEGVSEEEVKRAEEYRKKHRVLVKGLCPPPLDSFSSAKACLGTDLVEAMYDQGYDAPTPIQAQAWPVAARGEDPGGTQKMCPSFVLDALQQCLKCCAKPYSYYCFFESAARVQPTSVCWPSEDLVAIAETGSGKTCAYLLPALARIARWGPKKVLQQGAGKDVRPPAQPHALVMAPTRELVQQICAEARKFAEGTKARAMGIYGGVPKGDQVSALKSGIDLLVATPGRLRDFMTGDPKKGASPVVVVEAVTYVVLDEADRMLDMGFEPEIRWIVAQCLAGGACEDVVAGSARQTLFFTATWPKDVRKSAMHLTRSAVQIQVGQGVGRIATNTNIKQTVRLVPEPDKLLELKRVLASQLKPGETALVFAGRKGTCDALQQEPKCSISVCMQVFESGNLTKKSSVVNRLCDRDSS